MQTTVRAAQAGDQRALDKLIAEYLPLAYNVVGRALGGHADVDDVVQETMFRVVRELRSLRAPGSFRSWLVAIAMRQVQERWRTRDTRLAGGLDEQLDMADPGADFVDLTIAKLGLEGQQREVAKATRWLDADDRHLLSLWWLEAAGELTREELANALEITPQHAAVRVQRMKAQLEAARAVVRALHVAPRCPDLMAMAASWDGRPSPLWRKRFARHARECRYCERSWSGLVPADRLLAGLALVPLPVAFALPALFTGASGKAVHTSGLLSGKGILVATASTVVIAAGTAIACTWPEQPTPTAAAAPVHTPSTSASFTPPTTEPPASTTTTQPTTTTTTKSAPSTTTAPAGPVYGSNVDKADKAPPKDQPPSALPRRPGGEVTAIEGKYQDPQKGYIGGKYVMMYRDDHVTLKGRGYVQIRYEIAWFNRPGGMVMPTWTGLRGKLFHVASGGFRRMDDAKPGNPPENTWMGQPTVGPSGPASGYITLPGGAQQMWQNEFFYLDGEVTLTNNERGSDYNITATPVTWEQVTADITTAPNADPKYGRVRYGLVRDTGDDGAPVPQYATRQRPADAAQVPQVSQVSAP